jgi:hypothetical protein
LTTKHKYSICVILLTLIALLVYHVRFFNFSVLTYGDWQYFSNSTLIDHYFDYLRIWKPDESFGGISLDAGQLGSYVPYAIIAEIFKNSFALSERLDQLWPAALAAPIGSFLLFKQFFKSFSASFVGALAYSYNTYFLILQTGEMTIMAAFAFAPIAFYFFKRMTESKSPKDIILSALTLFIVSSYEPRAFYIVFTVLSFYIAWLLLIKRHENKLSPKRLILNYISVGTIVFLLNFFWIFTLSRTGSLTNNQLFSRGLFGSSLYNLSESLAMFHPYWTGGAYTAFVVQKIPYYFWLIPIFVILGLLLNKKNKFALFFGFVALLGVFLSKQAANPFPGFYQWAYDNIPGFNAFREASKFYFLVALAYSFLIGYFIEWLAHFKKCPRVLVYVTACLISALFLFNTRSLISGNIDTLFKARSMPKDYAIFNNFLNKQSGFFRDYWLPADSRWATFTNSHPRISAVDVAGQDWLNLNGTESEESNVPLQDQITNILKQSYAHAIFDASSIKYLIVPDRDTANNDDFFGYYDNDQNYYADILSNQPWLKRVDIGTKNLVMYKNSSYTPFISTGDELLDFPSLDGLTSDYSFAANNLNDSAFNFVDSAKTAGLAATDMNDIYSQLAKKNLSPTKLTVKTSESGQIYAPLNHPNLSYSYQNNNLALYEIGSGELSINNKDVLNPSPQTLLGTKSLNPADTYFLRNNNNLLPVVKAQNKYIGAPTGPVDLYLDTKQNLINNPSFKQGLWEKSVEDCNDYDSSGNPEISMRLNTTPNPYGDRSLELKAGLHTACSATNSLGIAGMSSLRLQFAFDTNYSNRVGYTLTFNDSRKTVLKNEINTNSGSWKVYSTLVNVPQGATQVTLRLLGYPNEHLNRIDTTDYDDVAVEPLYNESTFTINTNPQYKAFNARAGSTIEYTDPRYSYKNIIPNSLLAQGLWQKKVGDCNDYDNNPEISMKLSSISDNKMKSLELDAKRHVACTSPSLVNIEGSSNYYFSFDFQSPNGQQAGYNISFNDPGRTILSGSLPISDTNWHNFSEYIVAPYGATQMNVTFYSYAADSNQTTIITRYDNFKVIHIPNIEGLFYFVKKPAESISKPQNVRFTRVNSTQDDVTISGARDSFYLNLSEGYNANWRLEINNSKVHGIASWLPGAKPDVIPASDHYELDDFSNGWYVNVDQLCKKQLLCTHNSDGAYDLKLEIEFTPQRDFNVGLIISGLTLTACISYLARYYYRSNHKEEHRIAPSRH